MSEPDIAPDSHAVIAVGVIPTPSRCSIVAAMGHLSPPMALG